MYERELMKHGIIIHDFLIYMDPVYFCVFLVSVKKKVLRGMDETCNLNIQGDPANLQVSTDHLLRCAWSATPMSPAELEIDHD